MKHYVTAAGNYKTFIRDTQTRKVVARVTYYDGIVVENLITFQKYHSFTWNDRHCYAVSQYVKVTPMSNQKQHRFLNVPEAQIFSIAWIDRREMYQPTPEYGDDAKAQVMMQDAFWGLTSSRSIAWHDEKDAVRLGVKPGFQWLEDYEPVYKGRLLITFDNRYIRSLRFYLGDNRAYVVGQNRFDATVDNNPHGNGVWLLTNASYNRLVEAIAQASGFDWYRLMILKE